MRKEDFETIPPLEKMDRPIRTIVLSTDENYAAPAGVMITSLLAVSSPSFFYDIVVLDNGIAEKSRERLRDLTAGIEHAGIRFCDVEHLLSDAPVHGIYSKAVYLSLFVPYLFQTHEKVLCLDCDMIVRKDVSELFETEFDDGEYLAAARDVGIPALARGHAPLRFKGRYTSWKRYASRHLKFKSNELEDIMNAGVMLFNIPAFVADDFAALRTVERHIRFGYHLVDQCVINILFRGRIKYLHLRWNLQVQNWGPQRLITWFAQEYREAEADPSIIHYITHHKPWLSREVLYAEAFWRVARKTVWFHELYLRRFTKSFLPWINRSDRHLPDPSVSDTPLFSIIMPVYNRAGDLQRSLKSIRMQEFTDFEVIIIDDASTDQTVEEIRRLMREDPRIRLIQLKANGGPGPARNAGIQQARGKYIRICDSDDFYPPNALSVFARQIEKQESDLLVGNLVRWHSRLKEARAYPGPWLIDRDVQSTNLLELPELWSMLHFHRCAFRREFLLENGIEYRALRRGEDPAYMADVLSRARTFSLIKDPVYLFHARPRSHRFCNEEISDGYTSHELIIKTMTGAGFDEIAYFHTPFTNSHSCVTEEESLALSVRLVDIAKKFPVETFSHLYLQHPDCDLTGLRHDFLVAQNFTPERVSELMRRGLFSGAAREQDGELRRAQAEMATVNRMLHRFGLSVEKLRILKQRLSRTRAGARRERREIQPLPVPQKTCGDEPLFSIIMPVHNRAASMLQSLKSIQLQDFTDFEIIVVDDASTDRTVEEIRRLMREDPRIRLIQLEVNSGPGPARNAGIAQARGKYIRVCDSDDFFPPGALSAYVPLAMEGNIDVLAGNVAHWHSCLREVRPLPGPWVIDRAVQSTDVLELPELWSMRHFVRCAFRREFLVDNEIEYLALRRGEDTVYMADVLSRAGSFALIRDLVYLIHVRPRQYRFGYKEISDEYTSHELIIKIMTGAGFDEIAFFHSPFSMSHTHVTSEESLKLSARLIEIAKKIPSKAFDHPYFQHPDLDAAGLCHDLLVVQNSTPEAVSEMLRRGLLCASARERDKELRELKAELDAVQRWFRRIGFPMQQLRLIKQKLCSLRSWFFRTRNKTRQNIVRLRNARWEKWRKQGGDLPQVD